MHIIYNKLAHSITLLSFGLECSFKFGALRIPMCTNQQYLGLTACTFQKRRKFTKKLCEFGIKEALNAKNLSDTVISFLIV